MIFNDEYLGIFTPPTDIERLAHDYFCQCAVFDEHICTGRYKREAIPVTPEERRLCNAHASAVFWALVHEHNVTEHELRAAIRHATRGMR